LEKQDIYKHVMERRQTDLTFINQKFDVNKDRFNTWCRFAFVFV